MASILSIRSTLISQTLTKFPTHPSSTSYSTHFLPLRYKKKFAPPLSLSNNRYEKSIIIKASGAKEQKLVHEGLITESLPNGMFRVKLENGDVILGHISGRIRKSYIRILPGDKVKIEVSSLKINGLSYSFGNFMESNDLVLHFTLCLMDEEREAQLHKHTRFSRSNLIDCLCSSSTTFSSIFVVKKKHEVRLKLVLEMFDANDSLSVAKTTFDVSGG